MQLHTSLSLKEEETVVKKAINLENLDKISMFILDYSKDLPTFYGLTSVIIAVVVGVGAAILKKFFFQNGINRELKN